MNKDISTNDSVNYDNTQKIVTKTREKITGDKKDIVQPEVYRLLLIEAGGMQICSGDFHLNIIEPCLLLLPPGFHCSWKVDGREEMEVSVLLFDDWLENQAFARKECFAFLRSFLRQSARGFLFSGACLEGLSESFRLVVTGDSRSFDIQLAFLSLLFRLASHTERQPVFDFLCSSDRGVDPRIEKACGYIREHYTRSISQKELADVAHLSIPTLNVLFNKHLGCTFTEYLNRIRINRACALLLETDDPVSSIAYDCGFQTLSHFADRFKRLVKKNPTEYRGVGN